MHRVILKTLRDAIFDAGQKASSFSDPKTIEDIRGKAIFDTDEKNLTFVQRSFIHELYEIGLCYDTFFMDESAFIQHMSCGEAKTYEQLAVHLDLSLIFVTCMIHADRYLIRRYWSQQLFHTIAVVRNDQGSAPGRQPSRMVDEVD